MSNALTPDIRFKGFADDWEQRKLDKVAQYRNGKAHEDSISDKGKYIVVNSKFVSTNGEVVKFSTVQNEPLFINEIAFVLSDVPNGRAIAKTFLVNKNGVYTLNQRIAGITPLNNTYPYFLYILMNRHKYFLQFDDGAKQTNLSIKDVLGFESLYPNYTEQQQIGLVFERLDNLITLHQKELEKLIDIKKSMLINMFPQGDEKVPRIRFKGFSGDWNYPVLGTLGKTYTGLSGKTKEDFGNGYATYITYMNVFTNPITNPSQVDSIESDAMQNEVQEGDIFFTTSSETPEEVGMSSVLLAKSGTTYLNSFCFGYRLNENVKIDKYYLAYLLRSPVVREKIVFLAQGISRFNISKTKMMEIAIPVPEKTEEQGKIGAFFFNLDKLIEAQEKKIAQLKNIKSALLNKMFPKGDE